MAFYGTETEADTYLSEEKVDDSAWSSLASAKKQALLTHATRRIDRLNFIDDKLVSTQALEFPRTDQTAVPKTIEYAAYEIAFAMADGRDVDFDTENVDVIASEYMGIKTQRSPNRYNIATIHGIPSTLAWMYLRPYLRDGQVFKISRVN